MAIVTDQVLLHPIRVPFVNPDGLRVPALDWVCICPELPPFLDTGLPHLDLSSNAETIYVTVRLIHSLKDCFDMIIHHWKCGNFMFTFPMRDSPS